jgi:hypothetical protein
MANERELLLAAARTFDQYPAREPVRPPAGPDEGGDRPGDDFDRRASWDDVLVPAGWCLVREHAGLTLWRRPGKGPPGWSATTGVRSDCGKDLLYVFSSNAAPLESGRSYTKFSAYVSLNHRGDFKAGAKELAGRGYGEASGPMGNLLLNGRATPKPAEAPAIVRVPFSRLRRLGDAEKWFVRGLIPAEQVTIFSALPKAGKTTWLAHLLKACGEGGTFCGQEVRAGKVVYVTEESETIWAERRDKLGIGDHCEAVLRPFRLKPTMPQWSAWLQQLTLSLEDAPADLVVIDTLSKLWPVQNENDASEVTAALMPLLEVSYGLKITVLLVHHLRKGDGLESTQTRGSGGITAAVDSILELRRYNPGDRKDRRRVLSCDARYDDRLDEVVVELSEDGTRYSVHGDRADTACRDNVTVLLAMLPTEMPGVSASQILKKWPAGGIRKERLFQAIHHLVETGLAVEYGSGNPHDPHRYTKRLGT